MSRTAVLNKQQIIKCAYEIASEKGKNAITIREIGSRLGKSTAPIYTQYPSIEDILTDLKDYVEEQLEKSIMKARTNNSFLNMGIGILAFVIDNKLIFNDFFLTMGETKFDFEDVDASYISLMRTDPLYSVLDDKQLQAIMLNMQIYTYGLATMICIGTESKYDLSYYQKLLEQAGSSIIGYQLYSSGKYEAAIQKVLEQCNITNNDKEGK